jgi:pyruvate-formate lyase
MTLWENKLKEEGLYKPSDSLILFQGTAQGHITIGAKKVLDMGFKGIALQAKQQLAKLDAGAEDYEAKKAFYESVQISANAVCIFANRYAELAEEMAKKAVGERKKELLEIAERCRRVPAEPARNFLEAIQSIWMTMVVSLISYGDNAILASGRIDQYLYPYYKKDIESGLITREQALEAIEEYYMLLATNIYFGPNNVTIGGIDKEGNCAVNDVSYMFLESHKNLGGLRNGLAVRISKNTPREFIKRTCETHRKTAGVAFYNDDVVIRDLMEDGYSLADARDYSIVGCVEPTGSGNNNGYTGGNGLLMVSILEMALNEGRKSDIQNE